MEKLQQKRAVLRPGQLAGAPPACADAHHIGADTGGAVDVPRQIRQRLGHGSRSKPVRMAPGPHPAQVEAVQPVLQHGQVEAAEHEGLKRHALRTIGVGAVDGVEKLRSPGQRPFPYVFNWHLLENSIYV
jgi:hypothetical protein